MWKIIYNALLHVLLPFFVLFALTRPKIRKSLGERLLPKPIKEAFSGAWWIHAASVGEAVIAENLLNYLRENGGPGKFVVTTNTYYTRDLLRTRIGDRAYVCSLPFDIPFSIRHLIGVVSFKVLIIVETEIWPNLIWLARKKSIPVVIVKWKDFGQHGKTVRAVLLLYEEGVRGCRPGPCPVP